MRSRGAPSPPLPSPSPGPDGTPCNPFDCNANSETPGRPIYPLHCRGVGADALSISHTVGSCNQHLPRPAPLGSHLFSCHPHIKLRCRSGGAGRGGGLLGVTVIIHTPGIPAPCALPETRGGSVQKILYEEYTPAWKTWEYFRNVLN